MQGVVTDSLTREPLPYTSVYLKGTTEGGMTDDKGVFSFKTYRPEARLVISAETRALQEEKQSGCGVCAEDDRAPG